MNHKMRRVLFLSVVVFSVLMLCSIAFAEATPTTSPDNSEIVPDAEPSFLSILKTLLISMVPVIELRGALPIALFTYKLSFPIAFIVSYLGNIALIPLIIIFTRKVFEWIKEKIPKLKNAVEKFENKLRLKGEKAMKYQAIGLLLFVAIPIPGTGAWTGSMIAGLFNMRLKQAVPIIALGVLIAGIIVTLVSYGADFVVGMFA